MTLDKFIKKLIKKGLWEADIKGRDYKLLIGDDILMITIKAKKKEDRLQYIKDLMYVDVLREICKIEYQDDWSENFHKICHLVSSSDRIKYLLSK